MCRCLAAPTLEGLVPRFINTLAFDRRRIPARCVPLPAMYSASTPLVPVPRSMNAPAFGEFMGSGTCSGAQGRGCGLEMGRYIKAGDVVELEVEGIGILRNRITG